MIVELLIGAGLVAAGAAAARILVRRRAADRDEDRDSDKSGAGTKKAGNKRGRVARAVPRGLRVGDVLLYADSELWLAGMIELDEEGLVARLFSSPGGQRGSWVAQLDEPGQEIAALDPTDEVPDGAVPESLPIGGRRLRLERRGDAQVHTEGEHLPRTGKRGRYTILSDSGGRILIVVDFDRAPRIAIVGDRIPKHMIDLLPGGDLKDES